MTALADPETTLRRIAETADVFEAGGGTWLLAPAPVEDDDPGEANGDREPSEPGES